jgi:type IV secretory pathway TraG/TraD family ATPase VirD4
MPIMLWGNVTHFAQTDFRNSQRSFGIKDDDRFSHVYVIGKTGTGKSTLLKTMALQDIQRGAGLALIDPHGDLVEQVAHQIPEWRGPDVIYLNASDPHQPFGYNPLRHVREDRISLAASGFLEVFKKMWPDAWGVRMEHILRNVLLALLEQSNATMHDILRMFSDKTFRTAVAKSLKNATVKTFFEKEYDRYSFGYRADGIASIQNKVGAFLADPILNRILTTSKSDIHVRKIMDEGKILLVNLAKGRLGEDSSSVLGGLLVTTIGLAAYSRADIAESQRKGFFAYVDEFQSFTTIALANMLSELRKYRVGFTIAHQFMHQLDPDIRHAVLGNAGTIISFRIGAEDAPYLAREFAGRFDAIDLVQLPNYRIYLKLMIDGSPSIPFSAMTVSPVQLNT